jgi:sulfopropanediol 3-dehydrogenase
MRMIQERFRLSGGEFLKAPRAPGSRQDARELRATVSEMLLRIERDGEAAVRDYSRRLDGWDPPTFEVGAAEVERATAGIDQVLAGHIDFAREQIERFATVQRRSLLDVEVETLPGVQLGHRHVPVGCVGSYTPGGLYPMIASALMTTVVPRVAGVETVVACAPPRERRGMHPPQLYAMSSAGADVIVCLGGVQALASLAFGLCGLPAVDMIVGAGNAYVAEAKRQLFGLVGIDLLAGPTEILIVADDTADPNRVAADLLGQAEHGPTSQAILVTSSAELGQRTMHAVERWLERWPTAEVAGTAWRDCGAVILCDDDEQAVGIVDTLAPEHLELQTADDEWWFARLRNYGSVFIGAEATVAYGDKAIGVNHVLPTSRAARYTGGLWVGKFLKTLTYQRVTRQGSELVAPAVVAISQAEHFGGHALTAELRIDAVETPVADVQP